MSRIGKKAIEIPDKVKMAVSEDGSIRVEGPKGRLEWVLPGQIKIRVEGKQAVLNRDAETRSVKALHGLSRSLINNMVLGVSKGFQKALEIHGVGFRAQVQGKNLNLNIGFSHPVVFQIPDGIKITVQENTKILIEGIDKQVVGQVRAFDTRASRFGAKKERPYNNNVEGGIGPKTRSAIIRWLRLIALKYDIYAFASVFPVRWNVPDSQCIFQVSTSVRKSLTILRVERLWLSPRLNRV